MSRHDTAAACLVAWSHHWLWKFGVYSRSGALVVMWSCQGLRWAVLPCLLIEFSCARPQFTCPKQTLLTSWKKLRTALRIFPTTRIHKHLQPNSFQPVPRSEPWPQPLGQRSIPDRPNPCSPNQDDHRSQNWRRSARWLLQTDLIASWAVTTVQELLSWKV